jgi:hypothetical protein
VSHVLLELVTVHRLFKLLCLHLFFGSVERPEPFQWWKNVPDADWFSSPRPRREVVAKGTISTFRGQGQDHPTENLLALENTLQPIILINYDAHVQVACDHLAQRFGVGGIR